MAFEVDGAVVCPVRRFPRALSTAYTIDRGLFAPEPVSPAAAAAAAAGGGGGGGASGSG